MESLWNAADAYLATQFLANLGRSGLYGTLQVQEVYVWAQTEPAEWSKLETPFQVVMGQRSTARPAGHDGSTVLKMEMEYPYTVLSVVTGDRTTATRDAKILAHRVERLLSSLRFDGIVAEDGSKASRPRRGSAGAMYATQIELIPRGSHNQPDAKYGVAVTVFSLNGITA